MLRRLPHSVDLKESGEPIRTTLRRGNVFPETIVYVRGHRFDSDKHGRVLAATAERPLSVRQELQVWLGNKWAAANDSNCSNPLPDGAAMTQKAAKQGCMFKMHRFDDVGTFKMRYVVPDYGPIKDVYAGCKPLEFTITVEGQWRSCLDHF